MFWYLKNSLASRFISPNVTIAPCKGVVRGVVCNFTHLWKINAPVGVAAGQFDLVDFDQLIKVLVVLTIRIINDIYQLFLHLKCFAFQESSAISDSPVDVQPLWEYETVATSPAITFMEFDLTAKPSKMERTGRIETLSTMQSNGVAIWMDWYVSDTEVLSTGPKVEIRPGEAVTWERFSKQGVYFLNPRARDAVQFEVCFNELDGDISFNFF